MQCSFDPNAYAKFIAPIHVPEPDPRGARAALLGPDNGKSHVEAQGMKFMLQNHVEAARHAVSTLQPELKRLEHDFGIMDRKLAWTPQTISKPSSDHIGRARWLGALLLGIVSLVGAAVSVTVLSEYALKSASSLFADNNVTTAVLFATLPCLAAVSVKVFEQKLASPNARWYFGVGLFAAGIVSLGAWLISAAIALAPDLGSASALLSDSSNGNAIGIVLLLSTVLSEICLGSVILLGVGDLLTSKHHCEAILNPAFEVLLGQKGRLERERDETQQLLGAAHDYLARAEAGRELTRHEAEHELTRARELWTQAQTAALAFAIAIFLGPEGGQA